jgi:hypothetical protein
MSLWEREIYRGLPSRYDAKRNGLIADSIKRAGLRGARPGR